MEQFLTWEYVSSFIGMVFCVTMVTEYIKEIKYIKDINTKYLTSIVAFVLILFSSLFMGTFSLINLPLMILNAILITFTATGTRDFSYRKVNIVEQKNNIQ